jgi:hypothetical protein
VVKDMPDTMNHQHLITVIGDNQSVTFVECSAENKCVRMTYIRELIDELRMKTDLKIQAMGKMNLPQMQVHPIEVMVIGTE